MQTLEKLIKQIGNDKIPVIVKQQQFPLHNNETFYSLQVMTKPKPLYGVQLEIPFKKNSGSQLNLFYE